MGKGALFAPGPRGRRRWAPRNQRLADRETTRPPLPTLRIFAPAGPLREKERRGAYDHAERDQNEPETQGESEIALAGLEGDGGGHGAGEAANIAADDDD